MRDTAESGLPAISDAEMYERLRHLKPYTAVILKTGPNFPPQGPVRDDGVPQAIWEHGRRNMAMRSAGLMPIVCPVRDGSDVCGIAIFDAHPEDVDRAMSQDPGVKAGVFTYEVHPTRGFPGSALPG